MPGCGRTGGAVCDASCRPERIPSTSELLSSRLDKRVVCSPLAQDAWHGVATAWAGGHTGRAGLGARQAGSDELCRRDRSPQGSASEGPAGTQEADGSDLLAARGQDVLEDASKTLDHLEPGGPEARAARLAGGQGDGAVLAGDEAVVRDGAPEDRGGEGGQGGVGVWLGLRVDVPRDRPDVRGEVLEQTRLASGVFAPSAVAG
jgi:hypothetical protein